MLLAGALGVISSTQTWIDVTLADGAQQTLAVPGADAVPVLTPLSLAASRSVPPCRSSAVSCGTCWGSS
ncbi:hypothetical protein ACHM19_15340, partial [Clostridium perfringens]